MKRILGLVASQRKLGNGEVLVKAVAAAAAAAVEGESELQLLRLTDLDLRPCRGCYTCLIPGKRCPIEDDLYFLAEQIQNADAIIFSAPCYVLGPAAITKLIGDRMIALAQYLEHFWGKPCVIIGTSGISGWEGYTLSALISSARMLGWQVKDAQMFIGALPGEVLEQQSILSRATQMGQALFGPASRPSQGQCPTCWSEIWKFPEPGRAICPLCGQEAELEHSPEGIVWKFGPPGKRYEKEALQEHFHTWLRGKLNEYLVRRKELAEVRNPYKGGEWLTPPSSE